MTDAEKINEQATIDAKDDFEVLNEWLEEKKEKVEDIEFDITRPEKFFPAAALFSSGLYFGTRFTGVMRWIVGTLGLVGCVGAAIGMFAYKDDIKKVHKVFHDEAVSSKEKENKQAAVKNQLKEQSKEEEPHLKNVKIVNPV